MTDPIPAEAIEAARKAVRAKFSEQAKQVGAEPNTETRREENARERMRAALEAALPHLRPEPSEDEREKLAKAWYEIAYVTASMETWYELRSDAGGRAIRDNCFRFVDVLLATRRPTPSRQQVKQVLAEHGIVGDGHSPHSWRCSDKVRYPGDCSCPDEITDAVLALFKGGDQ